MDGSLPIFAEEESCSASDLPKSAPDPRNTLNDLNGIQWIQETKSFSFQKGLGASHPHARIERQHPAPFSYQDIQRLVELFTKSDCLVLDPFCGVGSTAKACALSGRRSIGIELSAKWSSLARERLTMEVNDQAGASAQSIVCGDARDVLPTVEEESVDFVVTSPPYWWILNKRIDHKSRERQVQNLATTYSADPRDLGNVSSYEGFLVELSGILSQCARVLKNKRYMALVVSDFRHGERFRAFHADLIQCLDMKPVEPKNRLVLQGVRVLLQNHKSLKPYGYPFAYVENVHHQYVLIFRKLSGKAAS